MFIFLKERLWVLCKVNIWIHLTLQLRPLQSPLPFYWEEDSDIEEFEEQKKRITVEDTEKKFIVSPADINVHRKVDLQDADVTVEQQNAFKELCDEYKEIFSIDSSNIGKTPLI